MRVLALTPEPPSLPHVNGGATRQYQLFKRMIDRGDEVTVIAPFARGDDAAVAALERDGFRVLPYVRPRGPWSEFTRAVAHDPSLLLAPLRHSSKDAITGVFWTGIAPLAEAELATGEYDAVVIEHAVAWVGCIDWPVPVLLTLHEVESPQFMAKAERVRGMHGLLRRVNGRRARRSERRWLPKYDAVITMSAAEAAALAQIVPDLPPTYPVGNGANPGAFDLPPANGPGRRVLFTGTMSYTPNRMAAAWLAGEVWPRVRVSAPDAQLEIVGRAPSAAVRALARHDGVSVVADAPDILPHLQSAHVCAIPMLEGGGTRLKLADAMAAGRAIVSTTNGATGVNVADGREVLIADGTEAFAGAIVELLRDTELRERLGAAARERALAELQWSTLGDRLSEALAATLRPTTARAVVAEA